MLVSPLVQFYYIAQTMYIILEEKENSLDVTLRVLLLVGKTYSLQTTPCPPRSLIS